MTAGLLEKYKNLAIREDMVDQLLNAVEWRHPAMNMQEIGKGVVGL